MTESINHLNNSIENGKSWFISLLESISIWTKPEEKYNNNNYIYFLDGEAFDWLVLAERLCYEINNFNLYKEEIEKFITYGKLPEVISLSIFKNSIGLSKYRGYLNYFYGITIEESLLISVESEIQKRNLSNGKQFNQDYTELAFESIYLSSQTVLLGNFFEEQKIKPKKHLSITENKLFTYWLFKYRLKSSDKSRSASYTKKGINQFYKIQNSSKINNTSAKLLNKKSALDTFNSYDKN